MTAPNPQRPFPPDKLLHGFSRTRFGFWLLLAVGIHVVVIGGTSFGYIRDWLDPDAAKARKEAAEAAQKAISNQIAQAAATGTNAAPAVAPAAAATNRAPAAGAAAGAPTNVPPRAATAGIPADRTNTAVVRKITETAKPGEIPATPDDLGISIQDTNPH